MPLRLRTVLRTAPGAWLAIPLVVVACAIALGYTPASSDAYAVAYTSAALIALVFVTPVCAAAAAWEGSRLRRGDVWPRPILRPRVGVALAAVLPSILAGGVAVVLAVELRLLVGGMAVPDGRLLALAVLVVSAHSLAGFAAGLVLPTAVALPAVMLASFAWMALPAAINPLWLRHLNGALDTCCLLGDELSTEAITAAALVAAGMVTASLLVVSAARPGALRWSAAAAVLLAALVSGGALASGLGPDPVTRRDEAALRCADRPSDVRLCVWPEHLDRLDEAADLAADAVARWRAAGLPARNVISESTAQSGHASFGFANLSTRDDLLSSLAYAQLPAVPACADTEIYPAAGILDDLQAWYALAAGMDEAEIHARFAATPGPGDEPADQVALAVRAASPEAAANWTRRNLDAAATCAIAPVGLSSP